MSEMIYDWMPEARAAAAQCWCDPETSGIQMDPVLAEAVARRIALWMQTGALAHQNADYWRERCERCEQSQLVSIREVLEDSLRKQEKTNEKLDQIITLLTTRVARP